MGIHMRGYGYGLVLSAIILYYKMNSKSKKLSANMMVCNCFCHILDQLLLLYSLSKEGMDGYNINNPTTKRSMAQNVQTYAI